MATYTIQDVEKAGVSVNSLITLFDCNDLDRGKLTALVNSVDTGFNTSFTSVSSTKLMRGDQRLLLKIEKHKNP